MGILWGQLRGCLPHHPVNSRTPKWNNSKQVGEFNYFSNAIFNNTTFMFLPKFPSNIEIMLFFDLLILFSHSFWFLFILIFAFVFTQSSFTLNGWNLFDISRGAISSWNKRLPLGLWTWHPAIWHECCLLSLILWVFYPEKIGKGWCFRHKVPSPLPFYIHLILSTLYEVKDVSCFTDGR